MDDEGDDYGDEGYADDDFAMLEAASEGDGETGLDEDAAGTDDEDSDEEGEDDEAPEEEQAARPDRAKVDPILRASNRSTTVVIVPPNAKITSDHLMRAEASQIIALRAQQISKSATAFVEIGDRRDPVEIAYHELYERRCPFRLRRLVGLGPANEQIVEEWDVRTMVYPNIPPPGRRK